MSSRFQRFLLPGFAFKAVVIGGGYATGRELAESELTRTLRTVLSQPDFRAFLDGKDGADELLGEVESTAHQVFLARKFYNDAVAATIAATRPHR